MSNYTLEVISNHSKSNGKQLKKHHVNGIDTIGVMKNEKFSVVFRNHTWQKVQVKISLDGTSILTGEPASTDPNTTDDMWVVQPYGTLELKAWPESAQGGAALIFSSAEKSVALHTHGDMSNRGIIAAAVYTEGHKEIITSRTYSPFYIHHYHYPYYYWYNNAYPFTLGGGTYLNNTTTGNSSDNLSFNSNDILRGGGTSGSNTIQTSSLNSSQPVSDCFDYAPASAANSKNLESLAAVGAGEYTEQKITYVAGLIKPVLAETIRVKYTWWNDLKKQLQQVNVAQAQPSGFPADKRRGINLGKTPRIGTSKKAAFPREQVVEQAFSRF